MNRPSPTRLTGWRRLRQRCCWSRSWSRSSTATATGTVPGAAPMTRWPYAAAGAGPGTGCWILISGPFPASVPHSLLLKAVAHHTSERWVLLYISRWLEAPVQMPDGTIVPREKGTPQGSPISPLLANLFMHYAFDTWMDREFPGCPFERYADDIVAHCDTEEQARELRAAIARRLGTLGLELHPGKTRIVYCEDANRRGDFEHTSFDFLGYTFRGRLAKGPRGYFTGFSPAISAKAKKAKGKQIRDWHLNRRRSADLSGLAREINPQVQGWINYYGAFYRSELCFLAWRINEHLVRWAMHKFKRFRGKYAKAMAWLQKVYQYKPRLFAHWQLIAFT